MPRPTPSLVPPALRRNHWMNQAARHATMQPDATAFRYRGVDTTWAAFHRRVRAFAAALERRGVRFGDRVLLLTLNSPEVVEAVLGINTLGAMAVPINIRLAPGEVAYIVDDADADVLVVDAPLLPLATAARGITDRIRRLVVLGDAGAGGTGAGGTGGTGGHEAYEALAAEGPGGFEPPDVPEDTPALVMYTSGTTGRPKGAMLDHGNLFAQSLTGIRASGTVDESDVGFLTAPLFHIAGLGTLAPSFVLGTPTVIHPLGAFDAGEMLDAWERERATTVFAVPTQWQAICAEPRVKDRDLALRVISWGAAPASEELLRTMAATFPDAAIVAVFGQTEMSPVTCVLRGEDSIRKLGSVGRPIPTIEYRIVDAAMDDVPVGEVGEIVYRGPTLMQGYWRNPEATAEAMAGGWFHSGDLVRQDDEGFIWVVDRAKDMIISGGENVYCAEVENVVSSHPAVVEVAVYGRADETWGEVPVAAVALAPGATLTAGELSGWLDGRLARFKHPKHVVVLDELPRNASGKVVKGTLRIQDPA